MLTDILIVFAIALIVGMISNRIKVPPLVAFILTGVIVGPYGLSIISGSEYSHQAASIVLPFRDIFTRFFFISVGMLVDIHSCFPISGLSSF